MFNYNLKKKLTTVITCKARICGEVQVSHTVVMVRSEVCVCVERGGRVGYIVLGWDT